jgi:predicted nucleotidyltransferase
MHLNAYKEPVQKLCESHHVKRLFAFGSVVKGGFNSESDLDFVVQLSDINPFDYSDNYFNLKFGLESLFNRQIDLLEEKAISNSFLKSEIDRTKVLIYEQ